MNIYEHFKVEPILNVAGTKTIYGGSITSEKVTEAMKEASRYSVHLYELQAAASKFIAQKTHAEAGLVTNGAFAAIALSAAACMCGLDVRKMNRLPNTDGLPNEFIMPWHQISGYARPIKAVGGKIIPVGVPNHTAGPFEVIPTTVDDVRSGISEKTAGILYVPRDNSHPPLAETITLAKKHRIPVILDAANQVPPLENLHHFVDIGADLVCFSGGKGIRGPQNSGILCGKRELICSAALQTLDMAVEPFSNWNPPKEFILKERINGLPLQGIGRGYKVSKEVIVGLLVALEDLDEDNFQKEILVRKKHLGEIASTIQNVGGVQALICEANRGTYPMLMIQVDFGKLGISASQVAQGLKMDRIYPLEYQLHEGKIHIHSLNMNGEIAQRVRSSLSRILDVESR